jgi:hypothetical protein
MDLSVPKCILLAVQYATDSDIAALRKLSAQRPDVLKLRLILQIVLTCLPESTEPSLYAEFIHEISIGEKLQDVEDGKPLDFSVVQQLSDAQARKKLRKLHLIPLEHPSTRSEPPLDPVTLFLIRRAYRIDQATGLLELIPSLIVPFLDHSDYLREWYISTVLPLLRLGYEYYPGSPIPRLENFVQLTGRPAIETLLSPVRHIAPDGPRSPARDLRCVVGPWMYGRSQRRKRHEYVDLERGTGKTQEDEELDDWKHLFEWLFDTSKSDFSLIHSVFMDWDGPEDVDLGGYEDEPIFPSEEVQQKWEREYAQSALRSIYVLEGNSTETLRLCNSLSRRLASLLDFDAPADLDTPLESVRVPWIATQYTINRPRPYDMLTRTDPPNFEWLQCFVLSAHTLSTMQYPTSIKDLADLSFNEDEAEQSAVFRKILHSLNSPRKDEAQWKVIRTKLIWLWRWNEMDCPGSPGIFGQMSIRDVETEILKAFLDNGHNTLAIIVYIRNATEPRTLELADVENIVLSYAMHHYDNASNGNRQRGGMKRASDIISAFSPHFPSSKRFPRIKALLAATHALSFYSLTLQHGVPFKPVNIRVMEDPLSLLQKLMAQNKNSYTHLDDLISIGQNLVYSDPAHVLDADSETGNETSVEAKKKETERRVIGMAVEAALKEDDFETAYSYVINRLPELPKPSTPVEESEVAYDTLPLRRRGKEDVAWLAAYKAGCYESPYDSWSSSMQSGTVSRPQLRRLEQRMELLSRALLLAPENRFIEVLSVWREAEKEMVALLDEEQETERRFNDYADRRLPGAFSNETLSMQQPRREVGRGAREEAPKGLFELAGHAAAALSRSAFPLRGAGTMGPAQRLDFQARTSSESGRDSNFSGDMEGSQRVRRRDMVASAVTGGLASGLGWVLGATPNPDVTQRD